MCGKLFQKNLPEPSWHELHDLLDGIGKGEAGADDLEAWRERTSQIEAGPAAMPMRFVAVTRLGADGRTETVPMRWGFSALGARNPSKPDHIHARAETLDEKPTFRDAFRARRGLVTVEGFNEAEELSPSKTRQYVIRPRDGKLLAIAVLWEAWQHPDEGELLTCVMVTTPPNALIATITDRMPAVVEVADWSAWLGVTPATPVELKAMLKPMDGDWEMTPETKKSPPPRKPDEPARQGELF